MNDNPIDKAWQTMVANVYKQTGKTVEQWAEIVRAQPLTRTGDLVKWLKEEHGFGHGYAGMIIHAAKGGSKPEDELLAAQYKGKEHFKPLYEALLNEILRFGDDIDISPKNAYVSLRRKRQFATLNPASKTRFEVQLNLKGIPAEGILEALPPGGMCSHRIKLAGPEDIVPELIDWIRRAYEAAG